MTLCPHLLTRMILHQEGTKVPQHSMKVKQMNVVSEDGLRVLVIILVTQIRKLRNYM